MARFARYKDINLILSKKRVEVPFRKMVLKDFPKESFVFLFGQDVGGKIHIERIWEPPADSVEASHNSVSYDEHVDWEAAQAAKEDGLQVVGDLHSHPWEYWQVAHRKTCQYSRAIAPSEFDIDGRAGLRWITGICLVEEGPAPKKTKRCYFRYWGPIVKTLVKRV